MKDFVIFILFALVMFLIIGCSLFESKFTISQDNKVRMRKFGINVYGPHYNDKYLSNDLVSEMFDRMESYCRELVDRETRDLMSLIREQEAK